MKQPGVVKEVDVDYVIVGAGISGLFLLAEALQQGFKSVVLIDRKDRSGPIYSKEAIVAVKTSKVDGTWSRSPCPTVRLFIGHHDHLACVFLCMPHSM